ncbi:MAG: hypothetical protein Q9192_004948 [Flavoplaca navasiana]
MVVNKTQKGIRYNQWDEAIPVAGSGLAMNLHWMIDKAPELRLYYQKGADGVMSADWTDWQNDDGVNITPWQSVKGWQPPTAPDIMRNVQAYSGISANGDRHVYAFEGGIVKEFVVSTDGSTWPLVGDVPITI